MIGLIGNDENTGQYCRRILKVNMKVENIKTLLNTWEIVIEEVLKGEFYCLNLIVGKYGSWRQCGYTIMKKCVFIKEQREGVGKTRSIRVKARTTLLARESVISEAKWRWKESKYAKERGLKQAITGDCIEQRG